MSRSVRFALLLVCFFLSGFAALLYETAWTREFAFVFGTSELAVAAVLAAYMAGLALGAAIAARLTHRLRRPVLVYGLLELGIALGALAVPLGIRGVTAAYVLLLGGLDAPPEQMSLLTALFHLAGAFVVLVPCTALMGATLPLLARQAVRSEDEIGPRVGLLYAINTFGAIAGTTVAAFWLLPQIGLRATVYVGVAVNALVFVAAALLARDAPAPIEQPLDRPRGQHWILPAIAISGAISFVYEVVWVRLLGYVLGGSTAAFSTMLASFLLGIALGSALASRLATDRTRAALGFGLAQLATATCAWLSFRAADRLPELALAVGASANHLAPGALVAGAVLLPVTCCIGATFPFAVRLFALHAGDAAVASARVYAWNTVGSIVGSIAAGFALLPLLGIEGTIMAGVAGNLALALAPALLERPRRIGFAAAAAVGLVALAAAPLAQPTKLLKTSVLTSHEFQGDLSYLGVGRSATVALIDTGSHWRVTTNGLPESAIDRVEYPISRFSAVGWLGMLPVLARPDAERVLVIGLGGGNTLAAVPSSVDSIDVIELEPEVVAANRKVPDRRGGQPLDDPRVTLRLGDARGALMLSEGRYDAIVSQPSHPWTSGASHLYTREFFELAKSRLEPDGVFVQWIGVYFVSEELMPSLLASLHSVFEHVEVYRPLAPALIFVASDAPLDTLASAPRALAAGPRDYDTEGIHRVEDIAATRVLDSAASAALAADVAINTDDHNRLATSIRPVGRNGGIDWVTRLLAPGDQLPELAKDLDLPVVIRRLHAIGQQPRVGRLTRAQRGSARLIAMGWTAYENGQLGRATRLFERARVIEPDSMDALIGLVALGGDVGDNGDLPEHVRALAQGERDLAQGDWQAVRALDPILARWQPGEILFQEALRMRVRWRIASGDPELAREALALSDALFHRDHLIEDYVWRAEAAALAGLPAFAWASLREIGEHLPRGVRGADGPQRGLSIAARLPPDPNSEVILRTLRNRARGGRAMR